MIYQLRGCCCAGKSVAVRGVVEGRAIRSIDVPPGHPFARNKRKDTHIGFELPGDMIVLGKYTEATSGGVEGIDQGDIERLVVAASRSYSHVLFEGFRTGTVTKVWIDRGFRPILEEQAKALPIVVGIMNTPWSVVEERLRTRTPDRLEEKPTNFHAQRSHWDRMRGTMMAQLMESDVVEAEWVDYERATDQLLERFRGAGWCG